MIKHTIASLLMFSNAQAQPVNKPSFTQTGIASWYGKENKISSTGKRLGNKRPEVAHKSLPIGSKVIITDTKTNKTVTAVVVDRGPYTKNRIVDLNYAAAKCLGIITTGTTKVVIKTTS
jgi:rare lipoprotein A